MTQYSVMGGGRFIPMVSREVSWIIDPESDTDKLYYTIMIGNCSSNERC